MNEMMVEQIVKNVLVVLSNLAKDDMGGEDIPVGISNRHIHLSANDCETLFGYDHTLTLKKKLKQTGEFAAEETVTLVGPKGVIQGVRVLGPVRKNTQVEISRTDSFSLGIKAPLRDSGDIDQSAGIVVVGACGAITLQEGVICANRHIHMHDEDAHRFGVVDGNRVMVEVDGTRGCIFKNVLVRVHPNFRLEFHIDTDEANAIAVKNGDHVRLRPCKEV